MPDPPRNVEEPLHSQSRPVTTPDSQIDMALSSPGAGNVDVVYDTPEADESTAPVFHTPPPHIAARFYKPTQQRRKGSAASSRRNSMSSLHSSHASSIAIERRVGPQSKHVAQQLRRASILEDRQRRLADRAAHAEKVRMRAATAKAASCDGSSFEERLLAAQQARDKKLADIAASCAEEVKRAKAIAETMKEKREQEMQKMRINMEEKQAEADRRREELRNSGKHTRIRGRGASIMTSRKVVEIIPEVEEADTKEIESPPAPLLPQVLTQEEAAWRIQARWRTAKRRRRVEAFSQLGLSVDGVRATPFDTVVELLAQEKVLVATAQVLTLCGLQEGPTGSVEEMAAVRTFLSAFLILGHPAQVLSNTDPRDGQAGPGKSMPKDDLTSPQVQELVSKARDLLINFEDILARLTALNNYTLPPTKKETLSEVYAVFHNGFIAWKARDSNALVEVMLMQFVELDSILESVKVDADPSVTIQYAQSIRDNQVKLLVRIKKLAGPEQGLKMVQAAVRKARKAKAAEKIAGDTRPRVTEHGPADEAALTSLEINSTTQAPSTPPRNGDADIANATGMAASSVYITPPATPVPGRIEALVAKKGGLLPDNRVVMHELSMDPNYRCSPEDFLEAETQMLKPLLASMRQTADAGEESQKAYFSLLLAVAVHIREKLQRLVKPGNSMHNLIGDLLDIKVAKQRFEAGSFSYEGFFNSMGSLLPKLCAPIRDVQVKELVTNTLRNSSYVDRLVALILFIDLMLSDYANHLIHMVAPKLLDSATQYGANCFARALQSGEHTLEAAEAAWRVARNKVHEETAKRDPEGNNHPKNRPTPDKIYTQMLVDVFTQVKVAPFTAVPEMLRLDYKRVVKYTELNRKIITAAAILLQCKNLLKRNVRSLWKNEALRIMTVLDAARDEADTVNGIMAALQAGRSMPAATKSHLRVLVQRLVSTSLEMKNQSSNAEPVVPRDPVLQLLLTRLRGHVSARLGPASASEKAKATSQAGEKLAGLGLAEFADKVHKMVEEVAKVGQIDREVHGQWWEAVAQKVEREQ